MHKRSAMLKVIRENLGKGAGVMNACNAAGVPYGTVWHWRNKKPMVERYFKKILTQRVQLVEDALYKGALAGNTTAQIFYLKNKGEGWSDNQPLIQQNITQNYVEFYRPEPYAEKDMETESGTTN